MLPTLNKLKVQRHITKLPKYYISSKRVAQHSQERTMTGEGMNFPRTPEEEKKLVDNFALTHPLHVNFVTKIMLWIKAPFLLKIWDTDKDSETFKYAWNSNGKGVYPNSLSNILFRTKTLHRESLMRFFIRWFPYRHTVDQNVAEEPPKITPNSVFVYLDKSNLVNNKVYVQKMFLLALIVQAFDMWTFGLYAFILYSLGHLGRVNDMSKSAVIRMDIIPEIEKIHIVKVGNLGRLVGQIVDPKDLVKISIEEVNSIQRFIVSRLWNPHEDREVIYKNVINGEEYTFIKNGIWNEEGVKHKLLN